MTRTLIAGGTGFIGQRLAIMLRDIGHDVVVIGTNERPCPALDSRGVSVHFADLAVTQLGEIIGDTGFDHVINLSGYIDHRPITDGGLDVFESHTRSAVNLINGVNRDQLETFVQIGTSDEYGDTPAPQTEAQREQCVAPYSLAKLANTHLVQLLARNDGFPGVVVRPFLVYGPGQSANRLIPFLIQQCLDNQSFDTSPGEQLRDFLYIDDFCTGVISLLGKQDHYGKIFNIASGEGTPVKRIIETVITQTGGGTANFGGKPYRTGESMALYADITAIRKATGWQPTISLEEGLSRTIASIRDGS